MCSLLEKSLARLLADIKQSIVQSTTDKEVLDCGRTVFTIHENALQQLAATYSKEGEKLLAYKVVAETLFSKYRAETQPKIGQLFAYLERALLSPNDNDVECVQLLVSESRLKNELRLK